MNETEPLGYASPMPRPQAPPNPIVATALCLPGLICWCTLLGPRLIPLGVPANFPIRISLVAPILWCWLAAVITAVVSVRKYWKSPKPWYVWLNLLINVPGLLFTGGILLLLLGITRA